MREKKFVQCDCENDIPPIEEQFNDIMENFDFVHVHMMMKCDYARVDYNDGGEHIGYRQWKTFHENGEFKVPSVSELINQAEKLLKAVIRFAKLNPRCKFYMTATGPFKATYRWGIIELECIFESWSCD